jgi:hypothetical protein
MALAVRYSLRLEEWAYTLLYYGPQTRGAGKPPDCPHWVGGLFTFRVERVGPFEFGQGPSWIERWVRTQNEGDKFQEEGKTLWVNAFPWSRNVDARDIWAGWW